jgi:hypothetical protein
MGRRAQAWFREFDGYWYGVVVKGTPPRKLLKASNTKANQRKADDIFRSLTEATNPDATLDASHCAVLVEAFLLHAEHACKPTTFRTYSDNLNYFTGHCGKVLCRELTFHHADGFLKKQAAKKKRKVQSTITVNGQERKHIVTVGPGGGLNGSYVLNASTVIDDGEVDTLWSDAGLDWFLTDALDEVHSASNETVTTS